jgi:hypothetical protein
MELNEKDIKEIFSFLEVVEEVSSQIEVGKGFLINKSPLNPGRIIYLRECFEKDNIIQRLWAEGFKLLGK